VLARAARAAATLSIALCPLAAVHAQRAAAGAVPKGESLQVVDTAFVAPLRECPAFATGRGPVVIVDEAHHNFHTANGRYRPFASLVERDGFQVQRGRERFDRTTLHRGEILVISNALDSAHESQPDWRLPAASAFDRDEIAAVADFVRDGGSLLLIADHMPFAGAASDLAEALGIHFSNGYALLGDADARTGDYPIVFRRSDGTLRTHAITNGRSPRERIDSIVSFTGSALRVTAPGRNEIMSLPKGTRLMLPVVAWQFSDSTVRMSAEGLLQGAALEVGKGRVAVFGEAAMFSAQRKGVDRVPMGMNAPEANQNPQFVLNVMHWLAGLLD